MRTLAPLTPAWAARPCSRSPSPSLRSRALFVQTRRLLAVGIALALVQLGCASGGGGQPSSLGVSKPIATPAPAPQIAAPAPLESASPTTPSAVAPTEAKRPKMNVLVLSIDSMRADMPWNGYGRDIAPVLTAFEKRAVSYTRHYSISSYTAMSLGGFLGGRYPGELERSGYFFGNYPDSVLMFPELLQKAGVRTMTAHAHFYFDQKAGFRQGFDVFEIIPGLTADNTTDRNITSPQHVELAEKMLSDKANTAGPFFAWFHFLDPHDVYMVHPEIEPFGKRDRDKYDGEIKFTDLYIGKLLDFVAQQSWAQNTAIIVTADHGEAFGEHKIYRHGFEIFDVLVHVPLMILAPGAAPRRIDEPRSSIDLAPTILELTGTPPEPSFSGVSLVPELFGAKAEPRDVIVDLPRTSDNDRRRALIHDRYKLLVYGDDEVFELHDVVADPGELRDLKRTQKGVVEQMKALYKERAAAIHDICPLNTTKLKDKKANRKC